MKNWASIVQNRSHEVKFTGEQVSQAIAHALTEIDSSFVSLMKINGKATYDDGTVLHSLVREFPESLESGVGYGLLWGNQEYTIKQIQKAADLYNPDTPITTVEQIRYKAMSVLANELGINKEIPPKTIGR